MGNTVLVVEHDEDTMKIADYIVDIGPKAGVHGGELVACGEPDYFIKNAQTITADYLSGRKQIEIPTEWQCKDTSDLCFNWGRNVVKQVINELTI